jgi:uncharacterized protein (TIGR02001 family)
MKAKLLPMLLVAVLGLKAPVVFAQDGEQSEDAKSPWVSTITFVSDYRFRGISQNLNDPALQLGTTYYHSTGLYAGAFASNVDFGGAAGANLEVDIYGGWGGELADGLNADVQLIRYNYPGNDIPLAYTELNAKLSYAGLTGLVGYSNDVFNTNETGVYYNLAYTIALADVYNISASLGRYDLTDPAAYGGNITDYSVGVNRTFGDSLTVGFSYIKTNGALEGAYGETNDGQIVFSMGTTF